VLTVLPVLVLMTLLPELLLAPLWLLEFLLDASSAALSEGGNESEEGVPRGLAAGMPRAMRRCECDLSAKGCLATARRGGESPGGGDTK
jgi:hypothetical protein